MIDHQRLLNWKIPERRQSYTLRDTLFYALSVGFGADPEDEGQVRYAYEKDLVVVPSMATALAAPGGWLRDPATGVTSVGLLAAEQSFEIHRALPGEGTVVGKSRVTEVADLGAERGAAIYTEREIYDERTNMLLATVSATTVSRKDGGFGGPPRKSRPKTVMPERAPDAIWEMQAPGNAALLYRLHNPIDPRHPDMHADLELMRKLGHPHPTLHGLYMMGVACHALLRTYCA
ncbi:MAG: 3-alpha,7-alpha,12-alpha-trihydroxy-5-beta-cholest-24-enoyl-CoA hydratase, partial [Rhodospirillaceae bacterium]